MANSENIEKYQFKKGQSGNPKGRPKNRVPQALVTILGKAKAEKFYKLSEEEISDWEAAVLTMTANELKILARWEDSNSYAKSLAISILFDMKNGNTKTIDKLRERHFGKAVQKVELTGKDGSDMILPKITAEDIDELKRINGIK